MKSVIAVSALVGAALLGPGRDLSLHRSEVPAVHPGPVAGVMAHPTLHEAQDRCRYEVERTLTVSAPSDGHLRLDAGSGSLEVVGVAGLNEVRAVARACASHEEFLDDLRLSSERNGNEVFIGTHYPDMDGFGWGNRYARLDLKVEVPEAMAAEIRDSSGEMKAGHLGDLRIEDSSGELEVYSVQGNVSIDDGSGEINLWDVTGNVEIDDGSGEIDIEGVGGMVVLDDGSGEINVRDVEGTVRVVQDGSGSIDVDGVGGDFIVERDGSGGINFRDVKGKVDIPRKR
jgi:hypothetical protein